MNAAQRPLAVPRASLAERRAKDVLLALREATAEHHSTIDRIMPLSRCDPTFTDYLEHLRLVRGWIAPLERWFTGFDSVTPGLNLVHRTQQTSLIDADLLEAGVPLHTGATLPTDSPSWPAVASEAYRWGVMYVCEGSRIGAAVLYRRLAPVFAPHPLRYLEANDKTRWPQFVRELRSRVVSSADVSAACQGARDGFDALLALCPGRACVAANQSTAS